MAEPLSRAERETLAILGGDPLNGGYWITRYEATVQRAEAVLRPYMAQHVETAAAAGGGPCMCKPCRTARAYLEQAQ